MLKVFLRHDARGTEKKINKAELYAGMEDLEH